MSNQRDRATLAAALEAGVSAQRLQALMADPDSLDERARRAGLTDVQLSYMRHKAAHAEDDDDGDDQSTRPGERLATCWRG